MSKSTFKIEAGPVEITIKGDALPVHKLLEDLLVKGVIKIETSRMYPVIEEKTTVENVGLLTQSVPAPKERDNE